MDITSEQAERIANVATKAIEIARKKYGFKRFVDGRKIAEIIGVYSNFTDDYGGREQEIMNVKNLAKAFGQIELLCQHIDRQKKLRLENDRNLEFTELGGKLIGSVIW